MIIEVLEHIPKNSMLKEDLISKLGAIHATFLHDNILLAKSGGSYYMLKYIGVDSKYVWAKLANSQSTLHDEPRTIEEVQDDIRRDMFQEILVLSGAKELGRVLSGEYSKGK